MADTPEKKVKKKVVEILKASGAYYFYPVMAGYGSSGVPDLVICYYGTFIGIECKAGNNKPTPLQEQNLTRIQRAGGYALVINEENIHEVQEILDQLRTKYGQ
jgi:Holliday junction resolvase